MKQDRVFLYSQLHSKVEHRHEEGKPTRCYTMVY